MVYWYALLFFSFVHDLKYRSNNMLLITMYGSTQLEYFSHIIPGVDLGLLAGGSQSVVVICHSTYNWGGATHGSFYLHKG